MRKILLLLLLSTASACGQNRRTGSLSLGWNPPVNAPSNISYRIYFGVASRLYTNQINLGNVLTCTVTGLLRGLTYYFAATDLQNGVESAFSNEVTNTLPLKKLAMEMPLFGLPLSLAQTNGQTTLSAIGQPYESYTVYATSDFKEWTALAEVQADAEGAIAFLDAEADTERFYRLVIIR